MRDDGGVRISHEPTYAHINEIESLNTLYINIATVFAGTPYQIYELCYSSANHDKSLMRGSFTFSGGFYYMGTIFCN